MANKYKPEPTVFSGIFVSFDWQHSGWKALLRQVLVGDSKEPVQHMWVSFFGRPSREHLRTEPGSLIEFAGFPVVYQRKDKTIGRTFKKCVIRKVV